MAGLICFDRVCYRWVTQALQKLGTGLLGRGQNRKDLNRRGLAYRQMAGLIPRPQGGRTTAHLSSFLRPWASINGWLGGGFRGGWASRPREPVQQWNHRSAPGRAGWISSRLFLGLRSPTPTPTNGAYRAVARRLVGAAAAFESDQMDQFDSGVDQSKKPRRSKDVAIFSESASSGLQTFAEHFWARLR